MSLVCPPVFRRVSGLVSSHAFRRDPGSEGEPVQSVMGVRTASLVSAGLLSGLLSACASAPQGVRGNSGAQAEVPSAHVTASTVAPAPARLSEPLTLMRCGSQDIGVRANSEQAEIEVAGQRHLLQAQRSASGARYASLAHPGTSFWSKGDRAMLVIKGQAYPECVTVAAQRAADASGQPPRDLTVREWVVERIDGRGVVDSSRTTLTFDAQGQIAGRAGCNRYTGGYRLQGAAFEVRGVATTRMACVPALMEQERRFLAMLGQVERWQIQPDGSLVLSTADQRSILAR